MYSLAEIRNVHLEISSLCNASCAWCPRNFWGYPYNSGYPEVNLTLAQTKKIFNPEFLSQLTSIHINGNFGDAIMNPETPDIVEYFRENNPSMIIHISTNGSARDSTFWSRLAQAGVSVEFALDGLSDTHHLYRQNTLWDIVIQNAKIFIQAGGRAVWKMIEFNHNRHQIEECRQLSLKLGFVNFHTVDDGRNTAPVFNRHGKLTHCLGDYTGEKEFEVLFYSKCNDDVLLETVISNVSPPAEIKCQALEQKSIYVAANGEIYPCCYLGLYPKTYGRGQYHQAVNAQYAGRVQNNNALEYSLEECMQWFNIVDESWAIPTFEQGRLVICNDVCGCRDVNNG